MTDNDDATYSPAHRVPKTSKNSMNKSIQKMAKRKEKAEKRKSNPGQTDIKEYFSNNFYNALSPLGKEDDDDDDSSEEESTESSTLSGEKRNNERKLNNSDIAIRQPKTAELTKPLTETSSEKMQIDSKDSESEVSVTPNEAEQQSYSSSTTTGSSDPEKLNETTAENQNHLLPIPNEIVPVVTPTKEKKKTLKTQERGGSKDSKNRNSSLKKPSYQVNTFTKRPSEQKRVVDVPLSESRRNIWRNEMKVNIPAPQEGKNSLETIRGKFIDFFENLSLADNKLILFPYKSLDVACGPITKWVELPDSSVTLKKYLNGLRPKPKGGDVYVNVLLGHSKDFNHLQEECEFFIQAHKAGIFKKQLACEDMLSVGYLLYSLRSINVKDYKQAFWEKYQIDLSLRWRIMQVEKGKYKKYEDLDQAPRALHIEVSKTDIRKAREAFRKEYS